MQNNFLSFKSSIQDNGMKSFEGLKKEFQPNWQGFLDNILKKGTPDRVYNIELTHDEEIIEAITDRFNLVDGVKSSDPNLQQKKIIAFNRFCGQDYVRIPLDCTLTFNRSAVEDTAALKRKTGREFQNEHTGPIMSWEDFEKYEWPDPNAPQATANLQWYQENLPEDMCIIGGYTAHLCEELTWLMGYETFCFALFQQSDLVQAIADRLREYYIEVIKRYFEFDRVKMIWASDDMGYKTGTLFSPEHMIQYVLSAHKILAQMAHAAGRPYILHSCGNLKEIMGFLINEVKIDAKHSFEDTIESICDAKRTWGQKAAVLGGIDVDFLCRSDEDAIRKRVRDTIDICQFGGGFAIGTGNTVANYIPIENYLTMVEEARLYSP
jgi:uroporphyrinogen decarboxylase